MSLGISADVGDSNRKRPEYEPKLKKSNHIFDGAGENIALYHSDSESLGSHKSKTRYINPAIYVETIESTHSVTSLQTESSCYDEREITPHPHSSYRSNSTPLLTGRASQCSSGSVKRKSCRLADVAYPHGLDEETPRNNFLNVTYREEGPDTFRLSVASLSTTTTAKEERERNERKKHEAFQQWLARKEKEKKERARQQKLKLQPIPVPSQEQREESFRRWLEQKKVQNDHRKAEEIMREYKAKDRMQKESQKKEREKQEKLAEWIRKKEEEMKVMKTKEERRAARLAIEEERRRVNGERAYRDWLRTSKNKPLPVPLNQGELSMRGSVSQMYINPIPWQPLT